MTPEPQPKDKYENIEVRLLSELPDGTPKVPELNAKRCEYKQIQAEFRQPN